VALRIKELVRTAPDWVLASPLSAEVTAWLDCAFQTVRELDPVEAEAMRVHAQYLRTDAQRHGAEIIEALHRVERKLERHG
jgi:hypothetical protein